MEQEINSIDKESSVPKDVSEMAVGQTVHLPAEDVESIEKHNFNKVVFSVGILLSALAIFVIGTFIFQFLQKPEGRIYLSLILNDANALQGIYHFDVQEKELRTFLVDSNVRTGNHFFDSSLSPDRSKTALVSVRRGGTSVQIHIVDNKTLDREEITQSSSFKWGPTWSPKKSSIAFYGTLPWRTETVNYLVPENNGVYITDFEGNEEFITTGVHPKFSPDGTQLLILKNDGLYAHNLETKRETMVWDLGDGFAHAGMHIELDKNGERLAWSVPDKGKIFLIKIHSWEPFSGKMTQEVESHAFWPVFSPDGRYLAAEEIDWPEAINQRLVIFDLKKGTKEKVLDLTAYRQRGMWVNEWR